MGYGRRHGGSPARIVAAASLSASAWAVVNLIVIGPDLSMAGLAMPSVGSWSKSWSSWCSTTFMPGSRCWTPSGPGIMLHQFTVAPVARVAVEPEPEPGQAGIGPAVIPANIP
jgi:hypothetical protein